MGKRTNRVLEVLKRGYEIEIGSRTFICEMLLNQIRNVDIERNEYLNLH